jgi:transposase
MASKQKDSDAMKNNNYGKRYTRQFKEDAVRLLITSGKTCEEVACDLGVSGVALMDWKRQAIRNGDYPDQAPPAGLRLHYSVLEQENLRLKKELEILRQEREILKKSLGILSQNPLPTGMP